MQRKKVKSKDTAPSKKGKNEKKNIYIFSSTKRTAAQAAADRNVNSSSDVSSTSSVVAEAATCSK